jgi:hypothetical protein
VTVLLDSRSKKALEIAAQAAHWVRLPNGAFSIPSQGNPGQLYVATPQMCQCPDAAQHPERLCKHSIAVSIVLALTETQPQATPTGLVATRVSEDEIVWERPQRSKPVQTEHDPRGCGQCAEATYLSRTQNEVE